MIRLAIHHRSDATRAAVAVDRAPVAPRAARRFTTRALPYLIWPLLPAWCRRLAVRLCVPRVSLGVCAVIRDGYGRVLVAHHPYRNAWGLPGGFVRRNEQPAAGLARELREELGVGAVIGPLLAAQTAPETGHLTLYYAATLSGAPQPNGVEIDALRHIPDAMLPALLDAADLVWRTPAVEPSAA